MEIIEQHKNFTCKAGFIDMSKITLYKKAKTGKVQVYKSWNVGAHLYSEFGELDGKMQQTSIECVGKNIGRANETSPEEQAVLEGMSKVQLKRDKGYFSTINEALTVQVFLPMLAKDGRKIKIQYPCDAQPKLDGVRCMAKEGDLMSRGGKPYVVPHISTQLPMQTSPDIVFDGELYVHGNALQNTVSLVKKNKPGSENVEYWVYDAYFPESPDSPWKSRKMYLEMYMEQVNAVSTHIKLVPTYRVNNSIEMLELHDKFIQEGYEGIILRTDQGVYELGHRSRNLIKYKEFMDSEFPIVGYKEGIGKFVGCVTWECITKEGRTFNVTPKGTLAQKKKWFDSAASIVGKELTVRYQALTNDGIPQFPVGIVIRDYE